MNSSIVSAFIESERAENQVDFIECETVVECTEEMIEMMIESMIFVDEELKKDVRPEWFRMPTAEESQGWKNKMAKIQWDKAAEAFECCYHDTHDVCTNSYCCELFHHCGVECKYVNEEGKPGRASIVGADII